MYTVVRPSYVVVNEHGRYAANIHAHTSGFFGKLKVEVMEFQEHLNKADIVENIEVLKYIMQNTNFKLLQAKEVKPEFNKYHAKLFPELTLFHEYDLPCRGIRLAENEGMVEGEYEAYVLVKPNGNYIKLLPDHIRHAKIPMEKIIETANEVNTLEFAALFDSATACFLTPEDYKILYLRVFVKPGLARQVELII